MKLADRAGLFLAKLACADEKIVVLDGDLADSDGAHHFASEHPNRFLMAGIAEQNMVSVAAGMATVGMRPFVFSFSAFLCYRAYDQIRVCLSQSNQPVVLVGSHAGGLAGRNGKTHAAINDLALMLSLPAFHVWCPADVPDVDFAINQALLVSRPAYIRLPRIQVSESDSLGGEAAPTRWIRPARSVSIVSTGIGSRWALEVADILAARGLQVGILHCLQLRPLPSLEGELNSTDLIVTVEDHYCFGGLGSLIAQIFPRKPRIAFGWDSEFTGKSGSDEDLRQHHGLASAYIALEISNRVSGSIAIASSHDAGGASASK
jgi:transketolase